MKVGELIEYLKQFDPELPVKVRSRSGSPCIPVDLYPPFVRVGPRTSHVLFEEVLQETPSLSVACGAYFGELDPSSTIGGTRGAHCTRPEGHPSFAEDGIGHQS